MPHQTDPSVGRLADAAFASSGMSLAPLDQRPGVLQDHRPFYDDPPPRIGSEDFLASEQPAPFRCLSRPPATLHQRVHSRPKFSDLRPPLRPTGQRRSALFRSGPLTFWSATAATSSRYPIWRTASLGTFAPASTEERRGCLSKSLAIDSNCVTHDVPRVHRGRNPSPLTLEPRLLEYT